MDSGDAGGVDVLFGVLAEPDSRTSRPRDALCLPSGLLCFQLSVRGRRQRMPQMHTRWLTLLRMRLKLQRLIANDLGTARLVRRGQFGGGLAAQQD